MRPTDRTLALVAATLGFAGAAFLACIWLEGFEMAVPSMLLVVSTTVVAGGLGQVASRRVETAMGFGVATFVAGAVNGAILGLIAGLGIGTFGSTLLMPILGAAFGLFCAMPFVPALTIAFKASRRVGRARPGSLVDEADRRAPWMATSLTILVCGMAVATLFSKARQPTLFALVFGAGVVATILAAQTARSWYRARGWQLAFADAEASDGSSIDVPAGAETFDLGLGEEEQELRQRGDAYRAGVRTKARLKGDAALVRRILQRDLMLGVIGTLLCVVATLWMVRIPVASPYVEPVGTVPWD